MITNRPLVPREIIIGDPYRQEAGIYNFFDEFNLRLAPKSFTETWHGLQKGYLTQEDQFELVLNTVGNPGMVTFLMVAVKNDSGTNRKYGVKVLFDGATTFARDRVTVIAGEESGFCIIGNFFVQRISTVTYNAGASQLWCPFDRSFQVFLYGENLTDISAIAAANWYLTTFLCTVRPVWEMVLRSGVSPKYNNDLVWKDRSRLLTTWG